MCVTVAVSCEASPSSAAETVTVLAVLQFEVENVRLAGLRRHVRVVRRVVDGDPHGGRGFGCPVPTVYVFVPPSSTVSDVGVTVTPAVSSSVTVTVRMALLTEL